MPPKFPCTFSRGRGAEILYKNRTLISHTRKKKRLSSEAIITTINASSSFPFAPLNLSFSSRRSATYFVCIGGGFPEKRSRGKKTATLAAQDVWKLRGFTFILTTFPPYFRERTKFPQPPARNRYALFINEAVWSAMGEGEYIWEGGCLLVPSLKRRKGLLRWTLFCGRRRLNQDTGSIGFARY